MALSESAHNPFVMVLEDEKVRLRPALPSDFQELYKTASDPGIWDQHNAHDRWKETVFKKFFKDGLENEQGMYVIINKDTAEIIGSTRFYTFNEEESSIHIGYTFLDKKYWGSGYNFRIKQLMLDHAFQFVHTIYFDIYDRNYRSQKAVSKLGASLYATSGDKGKWKLPGSDWKRF